MEQLVLYQKRTKHLVIKHLYLRQTKKKQLPGWSNVLSLRWNNDTRQESRQGKWGSGRNLCPVYYKQACIAKEKTFKKGKRRREGKQGPHLNTCPFSRNMHERQKKASKGLESLSSLIKGKQGPSCDKECLRTFM